jgi:hypothetical protein
MNESSAKQNKNWWQEMSKENLWYLVGLITSDGCLSADGRHIDITAKDRRFLEHLKSGCRISSRVCKKYNGRGQLSHNIQIGSVSLYKFLLSIGLMPNKSKKLSELQIPKKQFCHFLRGVIDGDGGIRRWSHPQNGGEQWSLRIVSGSKPFVEWLGGRVEHELGALGKIYHNRQGSSGCWVLKYGKMSAQRILKLCYCGDELLALSRKADIARKCICAERGWSRSKTLMEG